MQGGVVAPWARSDCEALLFLRITPIIAIVAILSRLRGKNGRTREGDGRLVPPSPPLRRRMRAETSSQVPQRKTEKRLFIDVICCFTLESGSCFAVLLATVYGQWLAEKHNDEWGHSSSRCFSGAMHLRPRSASYPHILRHCAVRRASLSPQRGPMPLDGCGCTTNMVTSAVKCRFSSKLTDGKSLAQISNFEP
jgi:hypothetical protein